MRGWLCRVSRTCILAMVPFPWIILDCEMVFGCILFKITKVWIANITLFFVAENAKYRGGGHWKK